MLSRFLKVSVVCIAFSGVLASYASAQENTCQSVEPFKKSVIEKGGKWIKLTNEQFMFMRGVYAEAPSTPAELPIGDNAVIASIPDDDNIGLFFLDGDMMCIPPVGLKPQWQHLLDQIGNGEVIHAGKGS
jgi:hypothetical protein